MGPTEYLVIGFEDDRFSAEIMPELLDLTERNVIRILDLVVVQKDAAGTLLTYEVADLPAMASWYDDLEPDLGQWFSQDDIEQIGESIPPSSIAALILVEHVWARTLGDAIYRGRGKLLAQTHVPRELVDEVEAIVGHSPARESYERRAA
jgi:hypothetical protein